MFTPLPWNEECIFTFIVTSLTSALQHFFSWKWEGGWSHLNNLLKNTDKIKKEATGNTFQNPSYILSKKGKTTLSCSWQLKLKFNGFRCWMCIFKWSVLMREAVFLSSLLIPVVLILTSYLLSELRSVAASCGDSSPFILGSILMLH